jgi:ATP-grasp domain
MLSTEPPQKMRRRISNARKPAPPGPKILLTATNRWPVGARVAVALSGMGCNVAAICPMPGHPIQKVKALQQTFHYSGFHPLKSVRKAIDAFDPDIVIPSCDRGVQHLLELHAIAQSEGAPGKRIATLIERSLGAPESFPVVSSRYELLRVARAEGILVPDMVAIHDAADLKQWNAQTPPPWVIKADGTWGGRGVRVADTEVAAQRYFLELSRPAGMLELIKRLTLNRDRDWIFLDFMNSRPGVIAQSHIDGRPANCAVVCWQGKLLAGIGVEVVRADGPKDPASVVQVVDSPDMMAAAERIARRLKLSGLFGLDFMIENSTGATYLIEMNPRCTPPCPLPLGKGRDLMAAMWAQLVGQPVPENQPVTQKNRIAYFPQTWGSSSDLPNSSPLETVYHDIPDGEPELVQELLHPWSERSLLGQAFDGVRRNKTQKKAVCVFECQSASIKPDHAEQATTSQG